MVPTLPNILIEMATTDPDRVALQHPGGSLTFGQLAHHSLIVQRKLRAWGVRQANPVLMLLSPGPRWMATAVGLLGMGATPVFVDPGVGLRVMAKNVRRADPSHVIGEARARWLRWLYPSAFAGRPFLVRSGLPAPPPAAAVPDLSPLADHDDTSLAWIAFTSGSTGVPKGVTYRQRTVAAQVAALTASLPPTRSSVDLVTFPIFALMNLGMRRTSVLPEMDFSRPGEVDGAHLLRHFRAHRIGRCFGSPALWWRVLAAAVGPVRGPEGPEHIPRRRGADHE